MFFCLYWYNLMENLSFHYKINLKKKFLPQFFRKKKWTPPQFFRKIKKKIHPVPPTSCRELFFWRTRGFYSYFKKSYKNETISCKQFFATLNSYCAIFIIWKTCLFKLLDLNFNSSFRNSITIFFPFNNYFSYLVHKRNK